MSLDLHLPVIGLSLILASCGGDMSDLEQFIAKTKKSHHGKVDPLPEFPAYANYEYNPNDLRDPFRPQTDLSVNPLLGRDEYSGPRPEAARLKEPLENYPFDSLKMVGLLQQRSQVWGLVRDPDGTIHRVQAGNYAGQNHGRIINVSENTIDIIELVPDGLSGWVSRDAQLAMAED